MPLTLRPRKEITLLLFLKEELSDWRPRTVKERLQSPCRTGAIAEVGAVVEEGEQVVGSDVPTELPGPLNAR